MEAIINFFTGSLNTVAWLYIFLPCTIVGGLYLTIRNRGIQFTRFGYAMKNTVGKMFQKQEAGAGAVTPLQAVTTALAATVGTGNIVRHLAGHRARRLRRSVLAVAGGAARYDDQIFRGYTVYPVP